MAQVDGIGSIAGDRVTPVVHLYRREGAAVLPLALALVCGGIMALLLQVRPTGAAARVVLVIAMTGVFVAAPLLLFMAVVNWWRGLFNRKIDNLLGTRDDPRWRSGAALTRALRSAGWSTLDTSFPFLTPARTWDQLQRVIQSASIPQPKAIVDARVSELCAQIGSTEELLDPESLDSRISTKPVTFVWKSLLSILVCSLLFSSCLAWRNGWAGFLVAFGLCIIFLAAMSAWPLVRGAVPRLRAAPIAAMGVVMDSRGRRWTSADSVLLVEPRDQNIIATLYGPAGILRMRFHNRDDEAFASLWRHWTHPHPRFDLLDRSG